MKLLDAYAQAIEEDNDPLERDEFTNSAEMKEMVIEEIIEAMKETRDIKANNPTTAEMMKPMFGCVSLWFIIGIRVGKILRDAELASK